MIVFFAACAVFTISFVVTAGLRSYALSHSLIDVPNARSSHTVPTPRGGGGAIVVAFLLGLAAVIGMGMISPLGTFSLVGASTLVAVLGFIDDKGHVPAKWRLLGHFAAAAWMIFSLGGFPAVDLFGFQLAAGWLSASLAIVYLVWLLNLYNFMDGIDGLAAVQAVTTCLAISLLYWLAGDVHLIWVPMTLALSVTGFLIWNFPPAKIFMGDVGSGFLGFVLGGSSIAAAWVKPAYFWAWVILLGVFIVDSSFTLLRRLLRGDRIYEAHRSHAYQYAARSCRAHWPVTAAAGLINVLWLLPMAYCVVIQRMDGLVGVMVAYCPLIVAAIYYGAGSKERTV